MDFTSNPNQRRITYKKIDGTNGYTKTNINAAQQAMKKLNYSAYMLYSYMALNANNYEDWFSPAILFQRTSFTESTYRKAFSELVSKGYLVQDDGWKSHYTFFESGIPETSTKSMNEKIKYVPQKNNYNVSDNNTDNIVNIVTPTALQERSATGEKLNTYFMDI